MTTNAITLNEDELGLIIGLREYEETRPDEDGDQSKIERVETYLLNHPAAFEIIAIFAAHAKEEAFA